MLRIAHAVEQLVARSDFAIEGLQTGCLNLSGYADFILQDVRKLTLKPVQKASVVVSLSRLAKKYQDRDPGFADFQLRNLVSRSGLTEMTYSKTYNLQKQIAGVFELQEVASAPFCVATFGLAEIAIVTDNATADLIRGLLAPHQASLHLDKLCSLTMQVGVETIDTPRQSYTVLKQLALRDITVVEYITSPTELTIILYERDLKQSFVLLHDAFFSVE